MTDKKDTPAKEKPDFVQVAGQPDYKAIYERAKKAGKITKPTFRIHTWTDDSAVLLGRVKDIVPFEGGKFEAKVNSYLIDTVDGLVSCIMGTYTDSQLEKVDLMGRIVRIEFTGKKSLEDGRSVNLFDVELLEVDD